MSQLSITVTKPTDNQLMKRKGLLWVTVRGFSGRLVASLLWSCSREVHHRRGAWCSETAPLVAGKEKEMGRTCIFLFPFKAWPQ